MPVSLDIKPNLEYLTTPAAILKICQFVLLMLAFSLITDCCDGGKNTQFYGTALNYEYSKTNSKGTLVERDYLTYPKNVSFFLAVTVLGWILVGFFFFLFFLRFHKKINQVNLKIMVMITSIAWSVLLLICCSLMASTFNTSNHFKLSQHLYTISRGKAQKWLDTMLAGVVFGFLSMIAFIVDAVLLVREIWLKRNVVEGLSSNAEQTQSQMSPGKTLQTAPGQTLHAYPGQANPVYQGQSPPVFSYPKQG